LVGEIAGASREQAQGIGQLNQAITLMDSAVQANAATAQESASAAEELNGMAVEMEAQVHELLALIGDEAKAVALPLATTQRRKQHKPAPPARKAPVAINKSKPAVKALAAPAKKSSEVIPFDDDEFSDF